nr:uncharacterized protein LOC129454102 [Misgurnus anguillicaudatus]
MDANLALTNADYACSGCNEDQASHLKDWLPSGYDYHFCTYRSYTTQGTSNLDHKSFEVSLRIALKEICEVKEWVKKLSESSGVSWRVAVTKPSKGQRVLYKAHYRCQHNVCVRSGMANQRRLSKNTQCGAKMVCTLVNTVDARGASSRSKDPHIPTYPTSVRLYNVHNHNIFVAEALRHRDVGAKAIETLTQLFEIGHNPTSALAVLKSDLLAEHGNKYVYASANRSLRHHCHQPRTKNLANMEAAGDQPTATLEEFLQRSLARMDHQDKVIEDMRKAVHAMVAKVSELSQRSPHTTLPTAPPTPPAPSSPPGGSFCPEPRLPIPEKYSGESNYCHTFLSHCSLHFAQQPRSFFLEETKVAFTLSLLTGKAAVWGTAVWENKDICSSFSLLSKEMKRVFDCSVVGKEAARLLTELLQGERSVSDYAIEFRTLAAECRWNEEAQWDYFLHGLADRI